MIRLRGGPADGQTVDDTEHKYIIVPVEMTGPGLRFGQARYVVERVHGFPVYAAFVRLLR